MKFIWEESDIIPGRRIKSPSGKEAVGMICYHMDSTEDGCWNVNNPVGDYSIVGLSGGTVGHRKTLQSITHWLTDNGYLPFD